MTGMQEQVHHQHHQLVEKRMTHEINSVSRERVAAPVHFEGESTMHHDYPVPPLDHLRKLIPGTSSGSQSGERKIPPAAFEGESSMRAHYRAPSAEAYTSCFAGCNGRPTLDTESGFPARHVPAWAVVPRSFRETEGTSQSLQGEPNTVANKDGLREIGTSGVSQENFVGHQGDQSSVEIAEASRYQPRLARQQKQSDKPRTRRPSSAQPASTGKHDDVRPGVQSPMSARGSASRSSSARPVQILRTPPRHLADDALKSSSPGDDGVSSMSEAPKTAPAPISVGASGAAGLPSAAMGRPMRRRSLQQAHADSGEKAKPVDVTRTQDAQSQCNSNFDCEISAPECKAPTQDAFEEIPRARLGPKMRARAPAGKGNSERYRHWSDSRASPASSRDQYTQPRGRGERVPERFG